jgi:hypothetical protein
MWYVLVIKECRLNECKKGKDNCKKIKKKEEGYESKGKININKETNVTL